jgi:hypothetical protein
MNKHQTIRVKISRPNDVSADFYPFMSYEKPLSPLQLDSNWTVLSDANPDFVELSLSVVLIDEVVYGCFLYRSVSSFVTAIIKNCACITRCRLPHYDHVGRTCL